MNKEQLRKSIEDYFENIDWDNEDREIDINLNINVNDNLELYLSDVIKYINRTIINKYEVDDTFPNDFKLDLNMVEESIDNYRNEEREDYWDDDCKDQVMEDVLDELFRDVFITRYDDTGQHYLVGVREEFLVK